jgi:hypothetical protein
MNLGICITVKNRSNLVVNQEDPIETYKHLTTSIMRSPLQNHFPPTLNRDGTVTLNLLPKLLMSLVSVKKPTDKWTVIIVDYESTDVNVPLIATGILQGHMPFVVHTEKGEFSRGSGLDIAANVAKQLNVDSLFFCDADMYFTHHFVFERASEILSKNNVYYPICFSFIQPDHLNGFWRDTGYGMMFIKTEQYFKTIRWQHNVSWGEEDNAMVRNFTEKQIVRERGIGYFHQWHPNSIEFKTQEYQLKYVNNKSRVS